MRTHSILVFYDAASHVKGLSSHALLRGLAKAAGSPGEEKTTRHAEMLAKMWKSVAPSTLNFAEDRGEGATLGGVGTKKIMLR